jgi:hypothetical protein
MSTTARPETVALTLCHASTDNGGELLISGLFDVVEHWGYEPSAGVRSPGFIVARTEDRDEPDPITLWVDEHVFIEQVVPEAHASALLSEREMDVCGEMQDSRKPYFPCPLGKFQEDHDPEDIDKGHDLRPTGREQGHLDYFSGAMVATEMRCTQCGMVMWDY